MKRKLLLMLIAVFATTFTFAQLNENFDGATFPPTNWTLDPTTGDTWDHSSEVPDHTTGTDSYARYHCYLISAGVEAGLITPAMDVTAGDQTLTFWANYYLIYGTYGEAAELYVDVTDDDGNTWTQGTTNYISGQQGNGWLQTSIDLGNYEGQNFVGSTIRVKFRGISDYGSYDIGIDDVTGPALWIPPTPIFSINPDGTKDYGECPLNNYSSEYYTQTFTVTNTGGGTLTINSTSLTGGDAAEFAITDNNTYPVNLTNLQSTDFVNFEFARCHKGTENRRNLIISI